MAAQWELVDAMPAAEFLALAAGDARASPAH
jgi:hypothetical protein